MLTTGIATRISKVLLMLFFSLFAFLTVWSNLGDYAFNLAHVRQVISMEGASPDSVFHWRSMENPWLAHLFFISINVAEFFMGVFSAMGAYEMWRARQTSAGFNAAKGKSVIALFIGVCIWLFGFQVVGGQWFLMWHSAETNAQQPAFRFAVLCLLTLIYLTNEDG